MLKCQLLKICDRIELFTDNITWHTDVKKKIDEITVCYQNHVQKNQKLNTLLFYVQCVYVKVNTSL